MGTQAPEYRINREIFTPYAVAAGVLNGNRSTKYVVNQNFEHFDYISFRELFDKKNKNHNGFYNYS